MPLQIRARKLSPFIAGLRRGAVDLLFPARCAFCGNDLLVETAVLLCPECRSGMLNLPEKICSRCAMPVSETGNLGDDCARCRRKNFRFDHVWPLGFYRDKLREAVVCMKRHYYEPLTISMGHLLAEQLGDRIRASPPNLIVPMPIHWTRRWTRKMNVAELLAESLRHDLAIATVKKLMACRRKLKKQGTLGPHERIVNVRGAFRVSMSYDIKNAHILLVDDVMTTGATANEAAKSLRKAGAARVDVVVVARALGLD